jgi:hypothetical protein
MLLSIKEWKPRHFGFVSADEVKYLRDIFAIADRTDNELQNLRDFVVMYYCLKPSMSNNDIMSAICSVIDGEKMERGMEI